ncbi:Hermansky-Pudlak syndrome 1 protein homolog isoform X1 [Pieris rapae]|uniref:Hermansky-Pudlak syndrome 1 protein homolog isoform X1 n=1 Tax=Pieris rapae TaxID=64459 RepID=UPI001E27E2E8|nr:Hermansky-Pudlak syndrome 1 protein homolog isoform X1 [Pieris rapae]
MKAILIFDSVNDLLYSKWDEKFLSRMKSFNDQESNETITDSHHISQLLSPIITSQRIMAAQFSNTYTSMQCKDKTSIVFDEWLDHVFMIISEDNIDDSHRELLDCKTLVQHICGQNINLLQSLVYQDWLTVLLDSRLKGDSIPGASGVIGESGATIAALNALKTISKELKTASHQHYHLMLFVGDKILALYSSRGSDDLMPPDLILLSTQCIAAQEYWNDLDQLGGTQNSRLPWLSEQNSAIVNMCAGNSGSPCAPHSLHLVEVAPRIVFVALIDMDLREVGIAAHLSSQILMNLRKILLQRNLELLPNSLDTLEAALKKTTDALRKNKANSNLCSRLTSRMLELRKSCTTTTPLTPETTATAMHTALDSVIELLKPDIPSLRTEQPLKDLKTLLAPYIEFLQVKAKRYFSLGSGDLEGSSLTLHKYVEEFPGLIHFIYVDRTTGRFLAPDMADCVDMLTPDTIRSIMRRTMFAFREGYGAATWRRGAIHVCAVRWWERKGQPLRPAPHPPAAVRALAPPGDILATFYRQLMELVFPNDSQGVSIKELVCIHLGLLPASTAVQQARRLAHSVYELAGENPAIASDLL